MNFFLIPRSLGYDIGRIWTLAERRGWQLSHVAKQVVMFVRLIVK